MSKTVEFQRPDGGKLQGYLAEPETAAGARRPWWSYKNGGA